MEVGAVGRVVIRRVSGPTRPQPPGPASRPTRYLARRCNSRRRQWGRLSSVCAAGPSVDPVNQRLHLIQPVGVGVEMTVLRKLAHPVARGAAAPGGIALRDDSGGCAGAVLRDKVV